MKIDMMGSHAPDDAQIEAEMQRLVNETWPPAAREKVLRTGLLKAELDAFFVQMGAVKLQAIADRDLLLAVMRHESAQRRLAIPALALGDAVMPEDIDLDSAERAAAQAVVDAASAEVLAWADARATRAGV